MNHSRTDTGVQFIWTTVKLGQVYCRWPLSRQKCCSLNLLGGKNVRIRGALIFSILRGSKARVHGYEVPRPKQKVELKTKYNWTYCPAEYCNTNLIETFIIVQYILIYAYFIAMGVLYGYLNHMEQLKIKIFARHIG